MEKKHNSNAWLTRFNGYAVNVGATLPGVDEVDVEQAPRVFRTVANCPQAAWMYTKK